MQFSSMNLSQTKNRHVNMEDELASSIPSAAHAAKEEPPETVRQFGEEHHTGLEVGNLPGMVSSGNGMYQVNIEEESVLITSSSTAAQPNTSQRLATILGFKVIPSRLDMAPKHMFNTYY